MSRGKRRPLKLAACHAKERKFFGLVLAWWGWSQGHKWRWHGTHIDLGPLSIYELKRRWLWEIVAILIWPLRWYYHFHYVYRNDPEMRGRKLAEACLVVLLTMLVSISIWSLLASSCAS